MYLLRYEIREEIASEIGPLRSELTFQIEAVRSETRLALEAVRLEVRHALETERRSIRIRYRDPLAEQIENAVLIAEQLRDAVAFAGRDVIVGHNVILWGGRPSVGTGIVLHDGVRLYETCCLAVDHIQPSSGISVEERVAIGIGCFIDGSGGVRIGCRTIIGPNVTILSSSHRMDVPIPVQGSGKVFGAVDIGEDVWIGSHVVIRMGLKVGDGAVIGAGSIVTRDVAPNTIVAGNPARVIRRTVRAEVGLPHADLPITRHSRGEESQDGSLLS
jgi:acetyltransferase-like isoleucine patch superfamily enzyme